MEIPFRLAEGIYFEDSKHILHWLDTLENIKKIDNPEINGDATVLKWKNKTCFDGQKVDVIVVVNSDTNQNGLLETVDFSSNETDPWETYRKFSSHFKGYIGQSNEHKDDGYGRPTELWNCDNLQIIIGVGERFVEFEIFKICKGTKRWKLDDNK